MLSVSRPETSNCTKAVINEQEGMWQDSLVTLFKALSRLAHGGNEQNQFKNFSGYLTSRPTSDKVNTLHYCFVPHSVIRTRSVRRLQKFMGQLLVRDHCIDPDNVAK
jgi:hypothetical protein